MGLTQHPLSEAAAVLVGLGAFVVIFLDVGWRIIRHPGVMAHEGAHAVVGWLLFRKVGGILMDSSGNGVTIVESGGCLGSTLMFFAGYVGPSLFGLGAARLIEFGHVVAVLWITLFLLGLLLMCVRWSFGIITVLLTGAAVYGIARYTPMQVQMVAGYAIAWLLLLTGVRQIVEHGVNASDGAVLASRTAIPRLAWALLWLAATLAALAVGGSMLVLGH
jgi:peptidase M50B-like protein